MSSNRVFDPFAYLIWILIILIVLWLCEQILSVTPLYSFLWSPYHQSRYTSLPSNSAAKSHFNRYPLSPSHTYTQFSLLYVIYTSKSLEFIFPSCTG